MEYIEAGPESATMEFDVKDVKQIKFNLIDNFHYYAFWFVVVSKIHHVSLKFVN